MTGLGTRVNMYRTLESCRGFGRGRSLGNQCLCLRLNCADLDGRTASSGYDHEADANRAEDVHDKKGPNEKMSRAPSDE